MFASRSKEIIKHSLALGPGMTLTKFIEVNNLPVNKEALGPFLNNLDPDLPIYITDEMITMFGYSEGKVIEERADMTAKEKEAASRKRLNHAKNSLNTIINKHFLDYEGTQYVRLSNTDYETKRESLKIQSCVAKNSVTEYSVTETFDTIYPPPPTGNGKATTTNLLVSARMLKELMMICHTPKSKALRNYYLEMINATELYIEYQHLMTQTSLTQKLDNLLIESKETNAQLTLSNQKLATERAQAATERAQAAERDAIQSNKIDQLLNFATTTNATLTETKTELTSTTAALKITNTTLTTIAKNHVETIRAYPHQHNRFILLKNTNLAASHPYHAIRGQAEYVAFALDEIKSLYTTLTIVLDLPQPNAVIFYNIIKRELHKNIVRCGQWFALTNITDASFKRRIITIDNRRSITAAD